MLEAISTASGFTEFDHTPSLSLGESRKINRQARRELAASLVGCSDQVAQVQALDLTTLGALLGRARSTLHADIKAGRVPHPDFYLGRSPRWRYNTISALVNG